MAKRLLKVTILFCLIIVIFAIPSFADSFDFTNYYLPYLANPTADDIRADGLLLFNNPSNQFYFSAPFEYIYYFLCLDGTNYELYFVSDTQAEYAQRASTGTYIQNYYLSDYNSNLGVYSKYVARGVREHFPSNMPLFNSYNDGLTAFSDFIENPPAPQPSYTKNPNVDEFIANTLISMGIRYSQYSDALSIASSAWNYIIDEDNWYIGSGDRNDKDIVWDIDNAVSYVNAQSNNYLDWYNGYKVNKDLTIALTKFISDNYIVSTLGQGTLAGYNVYYNGSYSYGTVGGTSGSGGTFGSSPNALSFYPASTITYFNGTYLHDNNIIDQDEFVYSPADVRKFIGYPSSAGLIEPPDSNNGTGVITDGNGDTIYNIDLDWPSFDWLAEAIQAVLDFLDRLITTIADFLTQILDAILSLFSDAFESLTEFGEGIIEWLYAIIVSFSTIGGNYIPASLWAIILPFILINIGVGLIMFVMRSH